MVATEVLIASIAIFMSIVCNAVAIAVFYRCRLIVFQIRLILLFITAHSFFISCVFTVVVIVKSTQDFEVLCALKCIFWAGYRIVPVVMTTVFAGDRSISIVWPLWYQRKITKQSIIIICLALTVALYVVLGLSYGKDATELEGVCSTYRHLNYFGIHSLIVLFASSMVVTTVSYAIIFYQSERYMSATNLASDSLYNSFRMSFLICGVTFALYLTSVMSFAASVALWSERDNPYANYIYIISASLSITVISINPIIYIGRFRESRFQVKKLLCFYRKDVHRLESALRLEHAGIPVAIHKNVRQPKIQEESRKAALAPKPQISMISLSAS
ncbi:mas-related G-protein coupled receptor member A-like [Argopecten irradians]|uniref:mas-related G-protein coupled receptor member A-like n=1 Tax=Argopecten irradians TaxID=31199 RepID=UPI0037103937